MSKCGNYFYSTYVNGNVLIRRSGFVLENRVLRLDETPRYDIPDIIEIKVTDKCDYECLLCPEQSKSSGINRFKKELLFEKLSDLPKLPITFVLSGGNLLENICGVNELIIFLKKTFKGCKVISNLNALNVKRVESLSGSFGKAVINSFIDNTDYFSISLGQKYHKNFIKDNFFSNTCFWKLHNLIFRLTYGSPVEEILKDIKTDIGFNNYFIISDVYNKKEYITDFINESKSHILDLKMYFTSESAKEFGILDNRYLLGWDNYLFIDSVSGEYSIDKKERLNWENISIQDFYDTYSK